MWLIMPLLDAVYVKQLQNLNHPCKSPRILTSPWNVSNSETNERTYRDSYHQQHCKEDTWTDIVFQSD